jgi:hypothetical protein
VSDPLELVAVVNPVRGSLALDPVIRARIETAVLSVDPGPRRRLRVPLVPRVVAVALVVLAAGSAAAAIGVLAGQPSAPPSGTFPGRAVPSAAYSLNITPDVQGGSAGWCLTDITFFSRGGGGDTGCEPAPTNAHPVVALGGTDLVTGTRSRSTVTGATVFITTAAVAAVRLSSRLTVLTRRDRQLPHDYRVAIALVHRTVHRERPQSVLEGVYGEGGHAVGLDNDGKQIGPQAGSPLGGRVRLSGGWWSQHGDGLRSPPAARCEVSLPGLTARWGTVLRRIVAFPKEQRGTYLSCGYAYLSRGASRLDVAVLLDARRPGVKPRPLPGALPVAGHPGVYVQPTIQAPSRLSRTRVLTPAPVLFRRLPGALLVLLPHSSLGRGGLHAARAVVLLDRVRVCLHLHGPLCPAPRS